jgi:hypothetical protein
MTPGTQEARTYGNKVLSYDFFFAEKDEKN